MRKLIPVLLLVALLTPGGCFGDKAGKIVFLSRVEGKNDIDIYSMNTDGSGLVKLARWIPRWMMQYHNIWSADGSVLAYIDADDAADRRWLAVVNSDGRDRRRLLDITDLKMDSGGMALSPDGKTVVLSLDSTRVTKVETPQGNTVHIEITEKPDLDLFIVDVKTGELRRLTDTPDVMEKSPSFSPNGRQIAFVGRIDTETMKNVPRDLFVMDADGNNRRHLVHHTEGQFVFEELRWSPDGSKIAYSYNNVSVSDAEHYYDVFVIDVNEGSLTNITDSPYVVDTEPAWSPDSRKLAIYSGGLNEPYRYRTIVNDIYDGSVTELEQDLVSWTPDGKGFIFTNPMNVFELMTIDIETKQTRSVAATGNVRIGNPFWLSK